MTENPNFDGGILLLDKPEGITSQTAVNAVRRAYGTRQAGHTGTLDPLATGLLCVLVGRAVKASEYAVCDSKRYEAVMRLGLSTDTEDITGAVLRRSDALPPADAVLRACERFVGPQTQIPPMYSALKVGGRKLCDLARAGVTVEREARPITVHSLVCTPLGGADYRLSIHCSSGTYVRSLCRDIGDSLGCGGTMAALRRVSVGPFDVRDAIGTEELTQLAGTGSDELQKRLLPLETLFTDLPRITLSPFYEKLYRSGCALEFKKLTSGTAAPAEGDRFAVCGSVCGFFSLGAAVPGPEGPAPEGPALKSLKLFSL